eukprot:6995144-Alexandrium_andersonii.AAC.1
MLRQTAFKPTMPGPRQFASDSQRPTPLLRQTTFDMLCAVCVAVAIISTRFRHNSVQQFMLFAHVEFRYRCLVASCEHARGWGPTPAPSGAG